jgi:hypothetical protein
MKRHPWSSGSGKASRPPVRHVAGSPVAPQRGVRGRRDPKIRPCPGRRTLSRVMTQQDTTRTKQQVRADPLSDHRRHRVLATRSRASRHCDLSRSSATSSHPIAPTSITTANSNHRRYLVAPRPPALGSAPPTVQSAPRVGTVVDQLVHGTRHRCGTDRRERGSQPEPNERRLARYPGRTYNVGPRSSGDRALVSKAGLDGHLSPSRQPICPDQ